MIATMTDRRSSGIRVTPPPRQSFAWVRIDKPIGHFRGNECVETIEVTPKHQNGGRERPKQAEKGGDL